jgi:hypothetical protein
MMRLDQKRTELLALPFPASDRERAERDAMIALASLNDVSPLRLAAFDEILAREFERGLDRLRPAAHEENVTDAVRGVSDKIVRQCLRDLGREEARMRISEPVELFMHCRQDIRMRMAQTGDRRAARGIDVFLARGPRVESRSVKCGAPNSVNQGNRRKHSRTYLAKRSGQEDAVFARSAGLEP